MEKKRNRIVIKKGKDLNREEIEAINLAKAREWKVAPMNKEHKEKHIFVLLKDPDDNILAQGQLVPIENIVFNGETFSALGIGGIIANIKGQGYGRELMAGITAYLKKQNKSGFGFTGDKQIGFYKKCGFSTHLSVIKRFVHKKDGKKIINRRETWVFGLDAEDRFLEKVLSKPKLEVFLPRDPDW
jgi:GNAT superfamily N-acetyltransferase